MAQYTDDRFWICQAEPVRPDLRRFNHKGSFGAWQRAYNDRDALGLQ
jgi:hypothetical protein